jgi:ribosome-binding factor A
MARQTANARNYPRVARINELLREIIAEEIENLDDDRIPFIAVTGIVAEADLRHALVYIDTLDESLDAEVLEALEEARWRLQKAIGRQSRVKHTPVLSFAIDPAVRQGERIDRMVRDNPIVERADAEEQLARELAEQEAAEARRAAHD